MKKALLNILILCMAICSALCVFTACSESPISFKLNFVVESEIVKTIDTTGNEKIALPENPTKDGYDFDGWFWDKDTWAKPFTANSLLDAPLSSDMSVYAKFTIKHEHNYTAIITAPTCTEKGYTTYTCECGDSYIDDYVDKLEHEFTNYVSDNNATYESDGTKTAYCNHGCGATDTITDVGTKLQSGIAFKTLAVDGNNVYGVTPNSQTSFRFLDEIEKIGNASYSVSTDIQGNSIINSKIVPLSASETSGDNYYYINVYMNGEMETQYSVNIHRRRLFNVTFDANSGIWSDENATQKQFIVEEDDCTAAIQAPTRTGYNFIGWNYNFEESIRENTVITASWTANIDTPYKVEYYLENLEDNNYTLQEIENKTGTTDTQATATIKTYEHFTHIIISDSVESGNINGDGSKILKVYYSRNKYTIKLVAGENITLNRSFDDEFKYGYTIEEVIATFNDYLGYEWKGWYSNDELIFSNYTIPSFTVDQPINYIAKGIVKEEMSNFNFTSTATICTITGIKDKTITEIIVPDYVTCINEGVFSGCAFLHELTIPFVGAKAIGKSVETFQHCFGYIFGANSYDGGIATRQIYTTTLTNSNTGTSITSEYSTIFYIPESLKIITIIGDNITSIDDWAFYNCNNLESITVTNNNIKRIEREAFSNCSSLKDITIPDSVISIGRSAFSNCSNLAKIYYTGTIKEWASKIDGLFNLMSYGVYNKTLYINNEPLPSEIVLEGITKINSSTFYNCRGLTNITIPNGVISIGSYAFSGCRSLTGVTIPDSVTRIEERAFENCSGLKSIIIPDSVKNIGEYAFNNCSSLMKVYYKGTEINWNTISMIRQYNSSLIYATRYYYSANEPELNEECTAYNGNFWHYDIDGVPVIWVKEN